MKPNRPERPGRRQFLQSSLSTAAVAALVSKAGRGAVVEAQQGPPTPPANPRIKFAAIGLNHGHISGQCDAVTRGGGELVAFYAKEPDLAANFGKRYPNAKLARGEDEI